MPRSTTTRVRKSTNKTKVKLSSTDRFKTRVSKATPPEHSPEPAAEPGDCDCEHKLRIQRLVESVAHERAECARLTRERDALRVALIEACDIASACSALIQSEGLDDDNEGPDVDADIARLRCATSAAKPPAEPKETT
jgi:hypothetical protein